MAFLLLQLKGMVAVITGATKGIGKAAAIALAQAGYNLSLCARHENDLCKLKAELEATGVQVFVKVIDCSQKTQVLAFCEASFSHFGSADVLVNNVGIYLPGNVLDEDDEHMEQQWRVNLQAAYLCGKFFGKIFRSQRSGHIFNICSVASLQPVPNAASYSVTKAAMLSLNHALRAELAPHGVKVTAVIPGSTFTASWEGSGLEQQRFVQVEDVAAAIIGATKMSAGANVDEIKITPLNF